VVLVVYLVRVPVPAAGTVTTASQFFTPALKRHNPVTVRKNVGETYHGCLRIDVKRSADLYRRIEGWASASMA
jgi:hypothetical protein